jgi:hypothetical protein
VAVEKGTNVVISRKFSLYGERVFNNLQTDFSAKTGPKEFFNSVGPGRWSGQSGKELVLAAPFLHPEMERQAMEVGRSVSGGFSDTEQQRGSKFRAQSSG